LSDDISATADAFIGTTVHQMSLPHINDYLLSATATPGGVITKKAAAVAETSTNN